MQGTTFQIFVLRSVQVIDAANTKFFRKRDTSFISEFFPKDTTTGVPKYFASWEDNVQTGAAILVAPTPKAALCK